MRLFVLYHCYYIVLPFSDLSTGRAIESRASEGVVFQFACTVPWLRIWRRSMPQQTNRPLWMRWTRLPSVGIRNIRKFPSLGGRIGPTSVPISSSHKRCGGWSIPRTPLKVSTVSSERWPNLNLSFLRTTAFSRCSIWPWWILRKNGQVGARIGAWSTPNWSSSSATVSPNSRNRPARQG